MLINHIPDKCEHLVRYSGYYSNRSRGARRLPDQRGARWATTFVNNSPVDSRRNADSAPLIQKVHKGDPLECTRCGATMHIIALIYNADVVEQMLWHLNLWDPPPETIASTGPDPPLPKGETRPLTNHPVPDIA